MNQFDYVNDINQNKKDIISNSENPELMEKEYSAFFINKALSYYPDTILYSNEMNTHHFLDSKMQFDYFLNSIRIKKRFSKWVKKVDNDHLEVVKEYFSYGNQKAEQALKILTKDQIAKIKLRLEKGGV